MAKTTILVVDDELDIQELVKLNLLHEGYEVLTCGTGKQALELARTKLPRLVVLDLMLPDIDGLAVCRRLKSDPNSQHIRIVMLTAKGEEADIVTGLELGADNYVTKPFCRKVLVARVRSILRRTVERLHDRATIRIHDLALDPARHEVTVKEKPTELTLTEYNILQTLARRPGFVLTRYQIIDAMYGSKYLVTDRAVDVQIVSLRKKLGSCGKYIETVRGVGYRFKD